MWIVAASAAILGDNIAYRIGRKGGRPLVLHHGQNAVDASAWPAAQQAAAAIAEAHDQKQPNGDG